MLSKNESMFLLTHKPILHLFLTNSSPKAQIVKKIKKQTAIKVKSFNIE